MPTRPLLTATDIAEARAIDPFLGRQIERMAFLLSDEDSAAKAARQCLRRASKLDREADRTRQLAALYARIGARHHTPSTPA